VRGIVYTGEGVEVTDELEVRGPGPNEVQVRMQAAGVCHSDLSVIDGTIPFPAPAVLGHEGAGVVEAVGDAVRSVKPGDHVVIATLASCGACRACGTGHPTWCKSSLGNISTPFTFKGEPASNFAAASVFSEVTIVSEVQAVRIPKDVPLSSACLIGCGVLTGVGAVLNRAKARPGDTAAVFGVGGVGLNVIQGLRIAGATRIVAVDTVAAKEELARQFGATHFVDASTGDAAAAIRDLVPADRESAAGALFPLGGVTWAFDCVGHPAVLRSALDCLDWGGNAVAIGIPPRGTEVSVDVNALAYVDRGLLGNRYGSARPHHDIPLMVDLYKSGQLMLDELVSLTRPLEQFGDVVDEMHAGRVARGVLTFD
jgi:Zn-dependent alcohol dehydrogenase